MTKYDTQVYRRRAVGRPDDTVVFYKRSDGRFNIRRDEDGGTSRVRGFTADQVVRYAESIQKQGYSLDHEGGERR